MKRLILCAALLIARPGFCQNLLVNGDFNDPESGATATAWTTWSYGGGWANHENNVGVTLNGSYYLVNGGFANAGSGEFQVIPGAVGLSYTLTVESGADAWWLPYGEMRLFFLDADSNPLGQSFRGTVDPAVYGANYDIAHPWASYSMTAVAPAGTTQVKVELASPTGTGSVWFENAVLTAVPEPGIAAMILLCGAVALRTRKVFRS